MSNRWLIRSVLLVVGLVGGGTAAADPPNDQLYVSIAPLEEAGPTGVVLFDVAADGQLEQRATYETDGLGRGNTSDHDLLVDPLRDLLFAVNNEGGSVSAFNILEDGSLSLVAGSPFDVGNIPTFLALHPELDILYVAVSGEFAIGVYAIDDDGALSEQQSVVSPSTRDLEVAPNGQYLYAIDRFSASGVRGFEVSPSGNLTELPGSPFTFAASRPFDVEISADGTRLFVLDLDFGIAVFDVDGSGALDLVAGSPFPTGGFAGPLLLSDAGRLYVGRPNEPEIEGYAVQPDGVPVSLAGSPFAAQYAVVSLVEAQGLARLYQMSRELALVAPFDIAADGSLIGDDPVSVVDADGRMPGGAAYRQGSAGDGDPVPASQSGGLLLLVTIFAAASYALLPTRS